MCLAFHADLGSLRGWGTLRQAKVRLGSRQFYLDQYLFA
jgi:hypothetical protein